MRKFLCILLSLVCLFGILGCSREEKIPENAVTVYFKTANYDYGAEEGMIGKTYLDTNGHEDDYSYLINTYLHTTPAEGFASTFPQGVSLVRFRLESLTANVTLSNHMKDCTGMDLTIALTCLTRTIISMTGCQEVILSAEDTLLNGEKFITLNADSFLLSDHSAPAQNESGEVE